MSVNPALGVVEGQETVVLNRHGVSTRRQGYSQKAEHHGKDSKPSGPRPSPGKYLFWHYALPFFCLLTCMSIRNDI